MQWRDGLGDAISWIAFLAICCAMVMTVGDIVVRTASHVAQWRTGVNPGWGLLGLVDLTQLAVMTAMPLGIAAAFFANTHIRVDLFLGRLSSAMRKRLAIFAALIGVGIMGICLWTAWSEMRGQLSFVTTSSTLRIAYTWYWLPLIVGLGLSVLGSVAAIIWPYCEDKGDV
jgi:TRAP-type C4-dicarboxylate transport system permease small subunit